MKVNFSDLGEMSVSSYCRKLIKKGVEPNTSLELYRTRETPDATVKHIGKYAKYTVLENNRDGPRFMKYRPPSAFITAKLAPTV